MKATLERIDFGINTSFKVSSYIDKDAYSCEITGWHIHPEYEIVYIRNGWGCLQIDHKTRTYQDGALLFLGPQIPHIGFGNTEFKNNLEVVVQFNEDFVKNRIASFPEFKSILKLVNRAKKGIIYSLGVKRDLSPLFEKFESLNNSARLINLLEILGKLAELTDFQYVSENINGYDFNSGELERLQYVFEFINHNYSQQFSTKDVADMVGLTTNSFCRFFKKVTNQSFIQFVNEFRVRKAAELLNSSNLSVSEVMYNSGYNDPSYFTRQFKKYQNTTPSFYKSKIPS